MNYPIKQVLQKPELAGRMVTWSIEPLEIDIQYKPYSQEFADVPHTPPDNLHSLSSSWPLIMWGMDTLEPLPKAPRAVKYLLVTIDYFTKWI